MSIRLKGGFATDIGISREKNEDSIILQAIEQQGEWFAVGAVCDGIGGLEQGEVASKLIISELKDWFGKISQWINIAKMDGNMLFSQLILDVQVWNQKVCEYCALHQIKSGTTLSLLMILRNQYYIIQVGDSRIYRYKGILEQLTQDEVTEKNGKSYLNNFIGKSKQLKYTTTSGVLSLGDVFLYCSDGFYHKFTQSDMKNMIEKYRNKGSVYQICVDGIKLMEERLEKDNISVGMIIVEG